MDIYPKQTAVDWEHGYRLALPFAVGQSDVRFHPAFAEAINYTSPVQRIHNGSLPERYGVSGDTSIPEAVLSPFTTLSGSVFSDGSFGVCYVAKEERVAIQEMADRLSSIMIASQARYAEVEFVLVDMSVKGKFHDYYHGDNAKLLSPEDDRQNVGRILRTEESDGILFLNRSTENDTPCLAVFNASCIKINRCDQRVILTWSEGRFIGYAYRSDMVPLDETY
jgi:hypothetical protein